MTMYTTPWQDPLSLSFPSVSWLPLISSFLPISTTERIPVVEVFCPWILFQIVMGTPSGKNDRANQNYYLKTGLLINRKLKKITAFLCSFYFLKWRSCIIQGNCSLFESKFNWELRKVRQNKASILIKYFISNRYH